MTESITKAQLSEYEHIVLMDFSGSMANKSKKNPAITRLQEAKEHVIGLTNYLKDVDEDGITFIPFSGAATVIDGVKDTAAVEQAFNTREPKGSTALHLALDAAQKKRESVGNKGVFIHVFTDGEPDDKPAVDACLKRMTNTMTKDADLAISFLQIGDDPQAQAYLQSLDDAQPRLGLKFDAVNTMTAAQSESLDYGQIMFLALND